ncbi:hypothetical protein C1H46_004696 [Malus baccata]|uniref:Uncharacterized protein n=1 Tax=Malus baccata TaxID=106549 RepID=A0A540NFD5_MALBA|nr:hypothetical protein C1H46_004696 [Malus baccata]
MFASLGSFVSCHCSNTNGPLVGWSRGLLGVGVISLISGATSKKNTRRPCRQLKTAKITRVTNGRITIGYDEWHRAAPTTKQHSALAHDIGHVVQTNCLMRRTTISRTSTTICWWGLKFPEIDVFSDVYVRPGDELAESFHATMMEKRQLVLQESAVQLPPKTPLESVDPLEDARF